MGVTCGHCAARVVKALESVEGVKRARLKRSRREAVVTLSADVALDILLEAVRDAGYDASAI